MAPIPPLTPNPPESTGPRVAVQARSELSDEAIRQSDAALIYVKLRKMIASDAQSTDTILGTIAVAAHSLTGATGAAIAMPQDGTVVCVGRSGETAPQLGDPLNVDSGISGECLRTGVIMRCDDASRDFHVDADVCRQLGLLSIAIVPLRGQHGRVGVLEAFSTQSYAFTEDTMEILGRLAGLAEAAWARGAVNEVPIEEQSSDQSEISGEIEPPLAVVPTSAAVPLAHVREVLATAHQESAAGRKWRYAAIGGAAALVLLAILIYGWRAWYRASIATRPTASAPVAPKESANAPAGLVPDAVPPAPKPSQPPQRQAVRSTADPLIPDKVVRRQQSARSEDSAGTNATALKASAEEIPVVAVAAAEASPTSLGTVLETAPTLPKLGVPISRGVAGGILVHKVQPVYPPEAWRMHVEGSVVIDAVVTVQGDVDELKLVSGHPMLAPAAMEAVRKWRYTPYSLNGRPIPKETRITVTFIAPQ
jgi:periplasmic protein TonB